MKTLNILWQRLVTPEGETCERCGGTYDAIVQAIPKLREALRPLGIEPVLETREIALDAFKGMPSESNRIWIAGRSIEDWLGAGVGKSTCCSALRRRGVPDTGGRKGELRGDSGTADPRGRAACRVRIPEC